VKGSDYKIEEIVGSREVLANGGEVRTIDYLAGHSTTGIVKKAQT
jgi:D-beta-D-heptose 7-phosphate kinase/D-beta-D-heptose 1-phosphate adenosyltransferase